LGNSSSLRVVPLGGLGEIGMNCMALEVAGEVLVIDCGVTFPRSDLGIDTFHPDFTWLEQNRDRIKGLVLTHGHEDHIGAVPYFAQRFDVPIWGPAYALELVRLRLDEHGFRPGSYELIASQPRKRFEVGKFEVEPVRVTHSIADATGLIVRTKAGTVVHTGDFKLDPTPSDGEVTDEERFREVGDEGVRLLLSDSTNIDSLGTSGSEGEAARVLKKVIADAPGRVIVGMFASNVQRMRVLGDIAHSLGRRLVLFGRSVHTHARVARDQRRIVWPSDLVMPADQVSSLKRREVLAVATGTQAERLAALWRMSIRTHPQITLDPGDRVIFSSRVIPGNEPAVTQMTNGFLRQGVDVRTALTDPGVHVSGHAYRDEQARMLDMVKPEGFIPVHGTLMHLHRHAGLAQTKGVREVVVIENGQVAELGDGKPLRKTGDEATFGKVPTWGGEEIPEVVIAERESMARAGVAFVTVLVDGWGRPAGPAAVATRGVLDEGEDAAVIREAARDVTKVLGERPWTRERPTDEDVADVARQVARKRLEQAVGKRPVMVAVVVRVKA
jgi:ribonuclease J